MSPGNVSECERHHQNRQSDRQRDPEKTDPDARERRGKQRRA